MRTCCRRDSRLADDRGSALPLTINLLAIGLAAVLIAAKVSDAVLVVEREQVLADSLAWRFAKEGMAELAAGPIARDYELFGAGRIRVELRVLPDGRTVSATACDASGLCASSKARSVSLAPPL